MSAPAALTWEQQEILDLRDKVDDLQQENEHLRSLLSGAAAVSRVDRLSCEFGLTKAEAAVLWSLISSAPGFRSKEALLYAARRRDEAGETSNLVSVVISSLRKKVATRGVVIKTVWGTGYRIEQQSRVKILRMIEKAAGDD